MPAAVAASEATKQSSFDAVPVAVTADAKEFDLIPPSANFGTPDRFSVRPSDDAADTTAGLLEHDGISAAVIGKENDDPGKTASSGSILMYSRGPESNGADLVAVSSLTKILDGEMNLLHPKLRGSSVVRFLQNHISEAPNRDDAVSSKCITLIAIFVHCCCCRSTGQVSTSLPSGLDSLCVSNVAL